MTGVRSSSVGSPTERFFEGLDGCRGHPLVRRANGTIRFDLVDGDNVEHWSVALRGGDVDVDHDAGPADAVVRVDRKLFDGMVDGSVNAMAATLRGSLVPEGSLGLVMQFQRLFGPVEAAWSAPRRGTLPSEPLETATGGGDAHG